MRASGYILALLLLGALVAEAQQAQPPAGAQGAPPADGRGGGGRAGRGGRGQPGPPPRIVTFEVRPASIKPGESALLVWHTENPAAPAIEPGVGRVVPRGTVRVTPSATTTYILTNGTAMSSVTVVVAGTQPNAALAPSAPVSRGITRTAEGKPDFSGVYGFGGGGARGGGRGAGAPAGPTLKPGAEKYRVNRADDPLDTGATSDCKPLIPPNAFGVPYPFQIIQHKDNLVIFHEYPGTFRIVPLDGQRDVLDPDPAWLGDSVGRWEGDTLVIDTIGYNDKTEINGFRHTEALHTVERLTPVDGGFDYEITIEDPNVFEAPWKVNRSFRYSVPRVRRIMEFFCENNRDYRPLFGTQK